MKTALRWLFAVLVLVNVGVFMWASWYRTPAVPPPQAPLPQLNPEKMVPLSVPGLELKLLAPVARAKVPAPLAQVKAATPAPQSIPVPKPTAPPPPPPKCVTVGPFDADKAAREVGVRLKAEGIDYAVRTEDKKEVSSYWVYLQPAASRYKAELMLKRLDRLGIRDHVIVTEGKLNNAISLGLYANPENARTRMRQMAKKGVKARQEVRYRTRSLYWLDMEVREPDQYAHLLSQDWGAPGVSAQDVVCKNQPAPGAASVSTAPTASAAASGPAKESPASAKGVPPRY